VLIGALATDYDGTLAADGSVDAATMAALARLRASGRKLLLVTGRELPQLREVFPTVGVFDVVVAENGALIWRPDTDVAQLLAPPPPPSFIAALRRRGVAPLSLGRSIVASSRENEGEVLAAIAEAGIDWRIIANKDSVMCLPAGVDKASGLTVALRDFGLAAVDVLGVGDAENDLAFLKVCGVSAAVANALAAVKAQADIVTEGMAGAGVVWLIDRLLGAPEGFGELSRSAAGTASRQAAG